MATERLGGVTPTDVIAGGQHNTFRHHLYSFSVFSFAIMIYLGFRVILNLWWYFSPVIIQVTLIRCCLALCARLAGA